MKILILSFLVFIQCIACSQQAPVTTASLVFKSDDGGKTWKDVSAGLPINSEISRTFSKEENTFLETQNGVFSSNITTLIPVWQKDSMPKESRDNGYPNPMNVCTFTDSKGTVKQIRGTRTGIWKSDDDGKTWRKVYKEGWGMEVVESEGVLIANSLKGIMRSTDDGESWELVVSDGGAGIDVEVVKGGFAAITSKTESRARKLHISKDGGKNWEAIDAGLPPNETISCIKEVGESFICGHPKGLFRSDDQGKTWKLSLPTIGKKVFYFSVLGKSIFAVLRKPGC
ncbi:MAG: exo-alpha-sialidase [Bacteroidia bacterium]